MVNCLAVTINKGYRIVATGSYYAFEDRWAGGNVRSGRVTVPPEWIDKKVYVVLKDEQ